LSEHHNTKEQINHNITLVAPKVKHIRNGTNLLQLVLIEFTVL